MSDELLNAQQVADMLKIARNTVYELIKRGDIKYSKVGKQVRVAKEDVNAYLGRTNVSEESPKRYLQTTYGLKGSYTIPTIPVISTADESKSRGGEFIICGQDISLDILANHLNTEMDMLNVYRSYLGSYNGIYSLYQGKVHIATAHLWDGDLDEYNTSYIKKMMPGIPALIMRIGRRRQGFYVLKGNPKGISGWNDLMRKDISMVNREKGSGTRVLLDEKLRLIGISGDFIEGYSNECKSHFMAASQVLRGQADIGIGSESGLMSVNGLDFIPLQNECYDLVMRLQDADKQPFKTVLGIISSDAFKLELKSAGGFDVTETGMIIW
jgi:DNA binding domain, excisionase family